MQDKDVNLCLYYRLKYFYFIDPEDAAREVIDNINKKELSKWSLQDVTELFDSIFYIIIKYTSPYTDYLDIEGGQKAFFGEYLYNLHQHPSRIEYPKIIRNGLRLSILHHCIIQSLYKNLAQESETLSRFNINARHYSRFQKGFFEQCENQKPSKDQEIEDHDNSIFKRNLYSQRYKTFTKSSDDDYSKRILTSFFGDPVPNHKHSKGVPYFQVIPYCNLWADFIYSDKAVHYFDRALPSPTRLLQKYRSLFASSRGAVNLAGNGCDKLLVSYPLDVFYGFQSFDSLFRLLAKIYDCNEPATGPLNYSDFQGQEIFKIIKLLRDTPLVYNRHMLIYFACEAITSNTLSENRYLKVDSNSSMHYIGPSSKSRNLQRQTSMALMEEFILHMNKVTIPLIFDLWNYIIGQINNTFDNLLDTNVFRKYIDAYYLLITADWTDIPMDEMPPQNINLRNGEEMQYFRDNLMHTLTHKQEKKELTFTIPKGKTELREQMEQLLQYYCNPKHLPSLFYKDKDIVKPLYFPFSHSPFGKSPEQIGLNQLRLDHAKFIYQLSTGFNADYNED